MEQKRAFESSTRKSRIPSELTVVKESGLPCEGTENRTFHVTSRTEGFKKRTRPIFSAEQWLSAYITMSTVQESGQDNSLRFIEEQCSNSRVHHQDYEKTLESLPPKVCESRKVTSRREGFKKRTRPIFSAEQWLSSYADHHQGYRKSSCGVFAPKRL